MKLTWERTGGGDMRQVTRSGAMSFFADTARVCRVTGTR